MRIWRDDAGDLRVLADKTVAIIGYGTQGRAQALNLRDSGVRVVVGARPDGASWARAQSDGFAPHPVRAAAAEAEMVTMLVPDHLMDEVYADLAPSITPGNALLFAHGFAIRFGLVTPPPQVDVILVAPAGPGKQLRSLYVAGHGMVAMLGVEQDFSGQAEALGLAYAKALGCTRAGVFATTFAEETECDLYGEQVVLCGGLWALVRTAFETLVDAGYPPHAAFFEVVYQVSLLAQLLQQHGPAGMRARISDTAEYGMLTRGPRIIDQRVQATMRDILEDVRNGTFAHEWLQEKANGLPRLRALRAKDAEDRLNTTFQQMRDLIAWTPPES